MKEIWKRSTAFVLTAVIFCGILSLFSFSGKAARYSGYGDEAVTFADKETETISYTKREENFIQTINGVPQYYQMAQYPNSCGAVAGAIVVGFYDKYYPDLIPNYTPTFTSGKYKNADTVYVPQLMGELYTLMRTNVDDLGVTEADCLSGLRTYVQNHGQSLTYTNIYASSNVSEGDYINAILNNRPVIIFCNKMELCKMANSSNVETITKLTYVSNHIMVAYGFLEIQYSNASGVFRIDKYLAVATGEGLVNGYYLKMNTAGWCDGAYSVAVY